MCGSTAQFPGQETSGSSSSSSSESSSESQTSSQSSSSSDSSQTSSSSSEAFVAPPVEDDGAVGETVNSIFVYKGMGLQLFGGNQSEAQRYAGVINRYQEILGDKVTIYNMVIPSHIEFVLPEKYKSLQRRSGPILTCLLHLGRSGKAGGCLQRCRHMND